MYDSLRILNLHLRETGFLYSWWNVKPPLAVEDRKPGAIAHLALARRQNRGNGILGSLHKRIITKNTEGAIGKWSDDFILFSDSSFHLSKNNPGRVCMRNIRAASIIK